MPQYVVGNLTPEYWYLYPEIAWLPPSAALGDTLRDLRPKRGVLSAFEVPDDASMRHIERIVAAIAAKAKEEPIDVGYRVFETRAVTDLGISVRAVKGETGDEEVNALHRNLENLTAEKLGQLATIMANGRRGELLSKRFETILRREVAAGRLKRHGIHGKMREALDLG